MLPKLATLTLLAVLLATAPGGAQTEIPGTVTAVDGYDVTIQVAGELLPRVGDEVRLRFRDPVPGAGLVFLDGAWEVSVVRRDDVVAKPRGVTARPQEGLVALITSNDPQSKDAVAPEPPEAQPTRVQPPAEPPVAATVRERDASGVQRIDRRRWVTISAGAGLVGLQSPTFYDFEPAAEIRPGLNASVGLHLLPNLAVSGYLGAVSVEGEAPDGRTQSAAEIYRALGATLYFGTPGNVPGDVHTFVQGGLTWFDVHYGGAGGDPDVTGTGFFAGGGLMVTLRRGFGLYFSGRFLGPTYDATHTVFQRIPVEIGVGATVIM